MKFHKVIRCVLEREKEEGALGVQGQPGIQETVSKTDEQSHSVLNQGLDLLARALDPTDGCSLGQRLREVWGCVCCSELVSRGSVLLSVVQSPDSPHPARDRTVCQPC